MEAHTYLVSKSYLKMKFAFIDDYARVITLDFRQLAQT